MSNNLAIQCLIEAENCEEMAEVHRQLASPLPGLKLRHHLDEAIRLEKKAESWLEKAVAFEAILIENGRMP